MLSILIVLGYFVARAVSYDSSRSLARKLFLLKDLISLVTLYGITDLKRFLRHLYKMNIVKISSVLAT